MKSKDMITSPSRLNYKSSNRKTKSDFTNTSSSSDEETVAGCCDTLLQKIMNYVHITYITIGLITLGYGVAIEMYRPNALKTIGAVVIFWSCLLIICGMMGFCGFAASACKRIGLGLSRWVAPAFVAMNITFLSYVLVEKDSFVEYLRRNQKELYLSDQDVEFFQNKMGYVYAILVTFSLLEVGRFYALRRLKLILVANDIAIQNELLINDAIQTDIARKHWEMYPDESMKPLLTEEERDEVNKSWWEEPDVEEQLENEKDPPSWFSKFGIAKPQKNVNSSIISNESSIKAEFAPINEEIDLDNWSLGKKG